MVGEGVPRQPKIYHIVHVDRLSSIVQDGFLWCDSAIARRSTPGTMIGIEQIKERRRMRPLSSYPDLHVGDCVPFYFCPRSIMLYLLYQGNHPQLNYRGGQEPIVHLQADLNETVNWAKIHQRRWVFTLSNAGSKFFEDRCDLAQLHEIDWTAVHSRDWRAYKEGKQAEFLLEQSFPWHLVEYIGVLNQTIYQQVVHLLAEVEHRPKVEIRPDWYY